MGRNWWGAGKRMHEKEKRLVYGSCGEGEKTDLFSAGKEKRLRAFHSVLAFNEGMKNCRAHTDDVAF